MPAVQTIAPYIGVTGVNTAEEARTLLDLANANGFGRTHDRNVMLGGLVHPGIAVPELPPAYTHKPWRHVPNIEALIEMLGECKDQGAIGMVHCELAKPPLGRYADPELDPYIVVPLIKTIERAGFLPPIQLNGVLSPCAMKLIQDATGVPLVLQLRTEMTMAGEAAVCFYLEQLTEVVSTVLMDASAGSGTSIDAGRAVAWHKLIEDRFPNVFSFGYAGGLGPMTTGGRQGTIETVQKVETAMAAANLPYLSARWDVESGVRRVHDAEPGARDVLDFELAREYFVDMAHALRIK
jgi:hypothetical protein